MAAISFVRVDFRLIHGQVITKWRKVYPVNKIIIVDNALSKDEFMQKVYESAAPSGIRVKIYSLEKAVRIWNKNQFGEGSVMILFKDIASCYEAVKQGIPLTKIQIGGAPKKADKRSIITQVSLSQKEMELIGELEGNGVRVVVQVIPEEEELDFNEITKRFNSVKK